MLTSRHWVAFLAIAGISVVVSSIIQCKPAATSPAFRNLGDSATYVGIQACKGCHSDKHATFLETGMGMSFHKAEKQYSKANFVRSESVV